jgi:hypothetical protein
MSLPLHVHAPPSVRLCLCSQPPSRGQACLGPPQNQHEAVPGDAETAHGGETEGSGAVSVVPPGVSVPGHQHAHHHIHVQRGATQGVTGTWKSWCATSGSANCGVLLPVLRTYVIGCATLDIHIGVNCGVLPWVSVNVVCIIT